MKMSYTEFKQNGYIKASRIIHDHIFLCEYYLWPHINYQTQASFIICPSDILYDTKCWNLEKTKKDEINKNENVKMKCIITQERTWHEIIVYKKTLMYHQLRKKDKQLRWFWHNKRNQ